MRRRWRSSSRAAHDDEVGLRLAAELQGEVKLELEFRFFCSILLEALLLACDIVKNNKQQNKGGFAPFIHQANVQSNFEEKVNG